MMHLSPIFQFLSLDALPTVSARLVYTAYAHRFGKAPLPSDSAITPPHDAKPPSTFTLHHPAGGGDQFADSLTMLTAGGTSRTQCCDRQHPTAASYNGETLKLFCEARETIKIEPKRIPGLHPQLSNPTASLATFLGKKKLYMNKFLSLDI
ncbi:hypothetical protein V6N13_026286 [Hibiscus sabdariffa]|uniref:Uncharacterized protein n=1 Tax=Hibiscus sabdariffa TaxID=183260 RepID=A0ABR2P5T5_9ROSI